MRNLLLIGVLALALFIAACGTPQTTAVPTADPANATGEPTVTPNPEGADEGTVEATAEADSTTEAAMEPGFIVNVSGAGAEDMTLDSNEGAVVVASAAGASTGEEGLAAANTGTDAQTTSSGQQVLNTPATDLRTLTFTNADQSYTFDLIFSADIAPGTYQIGVNNVQSTIGNNVNEDSSGSTIEDAGGDAEATSEATSEMMASPAGASTSTAQAGGSTAEETAAPGDDSASLDSNSPPSNNPTGDGVVERDETFAPTIAARLEMSDPDALSYNLVQGGMLNIESIDDSSASGSFEFTMSPADDPTQTITITGSFTEIPLGASDLAEVESESTAEATVEEMDAPTVESMDAATEEATMEATAVP